MDMVIKSYKVKKRTVGDRKVKWWNLTRENASNILKKIKIEGSWKLIEESLEEEVVE